MPAALVATMQWNAAANAGFTTGKPWLPLAPDYREVNVAAQRDAPGSMLRLYRELIALRRSEPALAVGRFDAIKTEGDVLAYIRRASREERHFLVALNLGHQPQSLRANLSGTLAISTHRDRAGERIEGTIALRPDEGVIVRLAA